MKDAPGIAIYILLVAGITANGYFMISNGEHDQLWWWLLGLIFFAWAAIPFVMIAVIYREWAKTMGGKITLLVTASVVTFGGIYILIETFITHIDPQSGLIFIFLPFFQCVAAAIGFVIVLIFEAIGKSKQVIVTEEEF